ncbi:MAG: hypothetical protein WCI55_13210 [Armatimonadota bacterium]
MIVISLVLAIQLAITILVVRSEIEIQGKILLMAYPILACLFLYVWKSKGNDNVLGALSSFMLFQILNFGLFIRQSKKKELEIL